MITGMERVGGSRERDNKMYEKESSGMIEPIIRNTKAKISKQIVNGN
jgi:hypothetical protein